MKAIIKKIALLYSFFKILGCHFFSIVAFFYVCVCVFVFLLLELLQGSGKTFREKKQ